ncbi:SGNH/GDSL hydrolase family protein [Cohnella thailandensis]|uniref:SGNH/GDSL hydrolase family protein n=1 Tax=Cohnella thailandensis TaxID=557557 RepID=A0A841T7I9_9BACL|nr:SGNH/GDSL hydrolase family protein [Cohnella thailandensis]MBB6637817.1 SGNH/GDSL hydrolase family protein [Cohnella thailandensis]MBP1974003.1 lysophospholipase L1-like esterase [Cohnella thailandensis]
MGAAAKEREEFRNEWIERSLIGTGNNKRIKSTIAKSRQGAPVTIAYLGGSITEGHSAGANGNFATLSCDGFARIYGTGSNAACVNAGMSGTPSLIGLIRVERDVLRHRPDIVFVEFAVNDSRDSVSMTAFESLLIRLLGSECKPAVVLLFTLTETGYSAQNEMELIGERLGLPMISVKDAILPEIRAGRMTWREYSEDNIHPNANGHLLIADMIKHFYETVDREVEDEEEDKVDRVASARVYGDEFRGMRLLESSDARVLALGGYEPAKTIPQFPNGWTRSADASGDGFAMELTCRSLFLVYMESKDPGTGAIDLFVDGEFMLKAEGYMSSGWNNPAARMVLSEETPKRRRVEIRMADGSKNKKFSILAFGYVP